MTKRLHHGRNDIDPRGSGAAGRPWTRTGVAVLLSILASGCVSRTVNQLSAPRFTMPAQFAMTGQAPRNTHWWRAFDDPGLDQLIHTALAHNFSLQASFARVKRARAMVDAAHASLFPTVTGRIQQSATCRPDRNQSTPNFGTGNTGGSSAQTGGQTGDQTSNSQSGNIPSQYFGNRRRDRWQTSRTARLTATYELDLWGRLRDREHAAKLSARSREMALRAAAMTTSADIASDWYQLQELNARLRLLRRQTKINRNLLELTRFSFKNGQSSAASILRQREAVESVRGKIAQTRAERQVQVHALAVLVGKSPQSFTPPAGKLVNLPALPQTGVPSALLMRRPDVRQDYYTIAADNRRVAAALADRYPQISLSAGLSSSADVGSILSHWLLQLTGSLSQTLFDGGAKSAKVAEARATVDEDVANYQQTMLTALREVGDALSREKQQKTYLKRLATQLAYSKKTVANLRLRYLRGAADYFDVLNSVIDRQNLQVNQLTGRYNLLMYRINLYRALAGGVTDADIGNPNRTGASAATQNNKTK